MSKYYYIYILSSKKNGTLYIGVTSNLVRRVYEHKQHMVEGFTDGYDVTILVYFEVFEDVNEALKREKQLKWWKRAWKIDLIEQKNPEWKDLYSDIC